MDTNPASGIDALIRHVIGDMLGRARKHGIAAPNLRMAHAVVQAYEAKDEVVEPASHVV